jgi:hypothetical protein
MELLRTSGGNGLQGLGFEHCVVGGEVGGAGCVE